MTHQHKQITLGLLSCLALLTAGGPFFTDMYLSAMPQVARELQTNLTQLTLGGFMLGMALGQLVIGPVSDRFGRKPFLLAGAVVAAIASVVCAISPQIWILIIARIVVGIGAGACVVLARTVVSDLTKGAEAAAAFSLMMMIQGLAPVIAPIIGGLLSELIGWRGIFWVLVGVAVLQLGAAVLVPESLPPAKRFRSNKFKEFGVLITKRQFVGFLFAFVFSFGVLFSYISASSFVFQEHFGLSALHYSLVFGVNAFGIMLGAGINAKLVAKAEAASLLRLGLIGQLIGVIGVGLVVIFSGPLLCLIPFLFLCNLSMGLSLGNATALAVAAAGKYAGSASGLLGFLQFALAGILSVVIGMGSEFQMMGVAMFASVVVAIGSFLIASRSKNLRQSAT